MREKPRPTFSWDALDAIRAQVRMTDDVIPSGAFTCAQYAERYEIPLRTAKSQLRGLVTNRKLQQGRKHTTADNGKSHATLYFWARKS